jgi:hypothetical protein
LDIPPKSRSWHLQGKESFKLIGRVRDWLHTTSLCDTQQHVSVMQLPVLAWGVLACLVAQVSATALTYKLMAHEKACFYTATKNKGEKIAFYFAVRILLGQLPSMCTILHAVVPEA